MHLITDRARRGHVVAFLTNDFDLQPGVVAFLSSRRREEETCFDTWKNDFSQAKVRGKRAVAIDNRMRPAIVTSILVAMMRADTLGDDGFTDTKALRRQARRQVKQPDQPDGTDWTAPLFRYTAKVSRQVLRFFKHCFPKPASPALYERELRPLLMAYLSGRPDTVAFSASIVRLYEDGAEWERVSQAGLRDVARRFLLETNHPRLAALLGEIGLPYEEPIANPSLTRPGPISGLHAPHAIDSYVHGVRGVKSSAGLFRPVPRRPAAHGRAYGHVHPPHPHPQHRHGRALPHPPRSTRVGGKVGQLTLLNLGPHFAVPPAEWPTLCVRLKELLGGRGVLLEGAHLPQVEREAPRLGAQRLARQPVITTPHRRRHPKRPHRTRGRARRHRRRSTPSRWTR